MAAIVELFLLTSEMQCVPIGFEIETKQSIGCNAAGDNRVIHRFFQREISGFVF